MTTEDHIDAAILELQHAKNLFRTDSQFAIACLGDARRSIAAAAVELATPALPLKRRIIKGYSVSVAA